MLRTLAPLDWFIVGAYLATAFAAGILVSRTAGKSMESYFVAGRSLPWWWLGTSMAATTFAADTPLVVSGLVAQYGIAGNWFWWSWAISHVSMAIVFAALWRRARVITDAEVVELRYAGRGASILRTFKAIFFAVLINGIVLGWVIRAMSKIATPFVDWRSWLGPDRFAALATAWPTWLLFDDLGTTLTVLALFGLITLYSTMGGIRGVILTDLLQFVVAVVGAVIFSWIAVDSVGGLAGLRTALFDTYPDAADLLAFVPSRGSAWLPVQVFAIYIAVQWWAQYFADGSGYLAQRLGTARSDTHAEAGSLWFCIANYGIRTWPWILVALVGLVLYPAAGATGMGADLVAADPEMAYPVLMARLLPAGLLGLLFASLLAAFMSTVDTHINWGASYLVNDLYRRRFRPDASERELVRASRGAVVLMSVMAILIAAQISSVERAWRFFVALGAGLGLPSLLRWLWWRANAWTEIAGMTTAALAAVVLYPLFPDARDEYLLVVIVTLSTVASLSATFLTPPEPIETLRAFVRRVEPPGFWRPIGLSGGRTTFRWLAIAWVSALAGVYGLIFGIGHALLGNPLTGALTALIGLTGILGALWCTTRSRAVETRLHEGAEMARTA